METGSVTVIYTQEEYYFRAFENMLTTSEHVLRKLFQSRWEEKFKENWDYWKPTNTQVNQLLDKIKKYLNKTQKSRLEFSCMGDWDMTLLCIVLTKFWDEDSHQFINDEVRRLKCLRNDMAHNPTKMISQDEYNQMVTEFSEHLQVLDVNDGDIKQMVQEAESITTITPKSSFVSSIQGINELTTWDKLSYGLKCVLLNRRVLFQGKILRLEHFNEYNFEMLDGRLLVQLANGEVPLIVHSHVPPKIDYYVKRTIRVAHILKREVFESKTNNDVFVIEGIEKWELTKLANGCETDGSSNQIRCLTVRFILLERKKDFELISKISKVPIHWIRIRLMKPMSTTPLPCNSNMEFEWVKSSGSVKGLQNYVIRTHYKECVDVRQFLSPKSNVNVMVLSGSPGMGKTCLLTHIAHESMKQDENVFVQFINLKEFVQAIGHMKISIDTIVSLIAEQSSDFNFGRNLVEDNLRRKRCLLMFDGFDEVLSHQLNQAKEILKLVTTLTSCLVIVTTRPHMRDELENELHTIAYELKPLNDSDQMVLLLKFWELNGIEANTIVQRFARSRLKCLQDNNQGDDTYNHVAGIPLQCQLLAEACLDEVERCSKLRLSQVNRNGKNYSIFDMYQAHMNFRLQKISMHESVFQRLLQFLMNMKKQFESIKEAHMYYALKLLFPQHADTFQSLNSSSISLNELCGLGILEATNSDDIRFVHRTFAEYLVAWFVFENMDNFAYRDFFTSRIFNTAPVNVPLSSMFGCLENIKAYRFEFPIVCYFINEFLSRKFAQIIPIHNYKLCAESVPFLFASAYHNYPHLLMTVANILHFKANNINDLKQCKLKQTYGSDILLTAAQYGDVELMKVFCKLWDISEFQFKTSTFSVIKEFVITPLHVAIQRGHYNLFEFLLNEHQCLSEKLPSLVHACLSGSLKEDKDTILQKKQIIRLLLMHFENCNTGENQFELDGTVKLFKSVVNAELLQCVVNGGADVSVCGRQQEEYDDGHIPELYTLQSYAVSDIAASCSERSFGGSVFSEPACRDLVKVRMSNGYRQARFKIKAS